MRRTITLLLFVSLLITSCNNLISDTSLKNKMKSLIEKVRQSIPENNRDDYNHDWEVHLLPEPLVSP